MSQRVSINSSGRKLDTLYTCLPISDEDGIFTAMAADDPDKRPQQPGRRADQSHPNRSGRLQGGIQPLQSRSDRLRHRQQKKEAC